MENVGVYLVWLSAESEGSGSSIQALAHQFLTPAKMPSTQSDLYERRKL